MDLKKRKLSEKTEVGSELDPTLAVTEDDITQLLEPLSRDQLLQITRKAAISHKDVLSEVRKLADMDPSFRKLFVRGLSWMTSREMLKTEFSRYGVVEESIVISDKNTGKSKGFGFVTFKHRDAAMRALKEPSKKIDGQMTVCHLSSGAVMSVPASAMSIPASASASASSSHNHHQVSSTIANRKVYVGNLPKNTHGDALLEFFSKFGEVEEGPLGFDRETGKCKGFALFIYKSSESAKRCLAEPSKKFNGNQINCKLAEPSSHKTKDESTANNTNNNTAKNNMYNPLTSSYDISSPGALANAYNPSSLSHSLYGQPSFYAHSSYGQSSLYDSGTPGAMSSYGIPDPLSSRGTSSSNMLLRGPDNMHESGSVASLYGLSGMGSHTSLSLPMSSHLSHLSPDSRNYFLQTSRVHHPLRPNNAQSLGYPSLSRSSYY